MPVLTRKLTLFPVGDKAEIDRVYNYIRNGQKVQAIMMNQCISALYTAYMNNATKEELHDIREYYGHIPGSKLGSPYDYDKELFPTGLPLAGSIPRACDAKLKQAFKDGLKWGKVSLPTFKNTNPLMVHNKHVNLYNSKCSGQGLKHEYNSLGELHYALEHEKDPEIYIYFANKIVFKIVFGAINRSQELRSVIGKVFDGDYKICDSTIGVYDKKIILNLAVEMDRAKQNLDDNVTVGVDLGLAVPAVCALNNNLYCREKIGSYNDFTRKRTQMQAQRKRIQSAVRTSKGGHGRNKKVKHLDKLAIHERNFAHNYNHYVSSEVIKFALKHNAKYINIENLTAIPRERKDEFVLRNWSYFELQQMIIYKATSYGMVVRKVNPAYTSQTCSVCGERGIRDTQSSFNCTNPDCNCHKIYKDMKGFTADFNAARNIAMSENFLEDEKKKVKEAKKKAS